MEARRKLEIWVGWSSTCTHTHTHTTHTTQHTEKMPAAKSNSSSSSTLKVIVAVQFVVLFIYTAITVSNHGLFVLFNIFFSDIAKMEWPGQFNMDFLCMLILSCLWTTWRNQFTVKGYLLGALAFVGGTGFLAPYLFVLLSQTKGDLRKVLLGESRVKD